MQFLNSLIFDWIWPLIEFLIGLNIVVFFHELGHYLTARKVGIKVERFALGMGPRLFGIIRGGTDYCVCALPLGGYVKMLGQEDAGEVSESAAADPRSFLQKTVGQRFLVVSAGVFMNIVLACLIYVIICMVGIDVYKPIVGGVQPTYPAATAAITWQGGQGPAGCDNMGLKAGDVITAVNGSDVEQFKNVQFASLLARRDEKVQLDFDRSADGRTYRGSVELGVRPGGIKGLLSFGIDAPASNRVWGAAVDSQLKINDEIIAINGKKVANEWEMEHAGDELTNGPVRLTVLRDGEEKQLTVTPIPYNRSDMIFLKNGRVIYGLPEKVDGDRTVIILDNGRQIDVVTKNIASGNGSGLDVLGLSPRLMTYDTKKWKGIFRHTPAWNAGIKNGDILLSYDETVNPTQSEILQISANLLKEKRSGELVCLRDGEKKTFEIEPYKSEGVALIGVSFTGDYEHPVAGFVRHGSPAAKAGIKSGSRIIAVGSRPVKNWMDIVWAVKALPKETRVLPITTDAGEFSLNIPESFNASDIRLSVLGMVALRPDTFKLHRKNPLAAMAWGAKEAWETILLNYASLRAIATGTVPAREASGPLGLGKMAIDQAKHGIVPLMYLMAFLSAALAVFNFLPLPVLDGGIATLLIIEKLRGKPLPLKVINMIQLAGLVFILGLFILVTFSDFLKLFDI
ncbi:MAG TPA: RIP metalloprotease RseP, partial [Phycisphaerae bacterium]|nr:RIP metalloprotease RseP [Phycisphaerae bacterium]HPS53027.1 RIP metalloprotease RseP [Phycisphaerae bacterium]